jgi:hypothetical protein
MDAYVAGWYVLTPIPARMKNPITRERRGMKAPAKSAADASRKLKATSRPRCTRSDSLPVSIEETAIVERYAATNAPAAA